MIGYEEGHMEKRSKRAVVLLCGIGLWIFYLFQQELAEYGLYTIISYNVHELASVIPFLCMGTAVIWCGYLLVKAAKKKCDGQEYLITYEQNGETSELQQISSLK